MKIISWNCNGALRKKLSEIERFDADLLIIQECEDPAQSKDRAYANWARNYLWAGKNKNKGLGVFAQKSIILEPVTLDAGPLELFLPCKINREISLLATWTREAHSPTFRYIGQLWKYLQAHSSFLCSDQSLLIGDLNSNSCWDVWDRWWNHSDVVQQLKNIGLHSLYHHYQNEEQGRETTPTFYLYRKPERPYHIDYAFLSQKLLASASIKLGSAMQWLPVSDHMPLEINLETPL